MRLVPLLAIILLVASACSAEPTLKERAQRVAAQLPWDRPLGAISDRDLYSGPDTAKVAQILKLLEPPPAIADAVNQAENALVPADRPLPEYLQSPHWSVDEIRPLLKDPDPKVRTIGLVLLFGLNRLDVLPDIASLRNDDAETFPTPGLISATEDPRTAKWPMRKTTVSEYARQMIWLYQRSSDEFGNPGYVDGNVAPAVLAAFAAKRDPSLATVALCVAMDRARAIPAPAERLANVEGVLDALNDIPAPRRFFVALALDFDELRPPQPYALDYLLRLARQVPRKARLAAISCQRPIDDPDIRAGFGYRFFLQHADDLFLESDTNLILQIEADLRKAPPKTSDSSFRVSPDYAIAAATLRPQDAEKILTDAMDRFAAESQYRERRDLAIALARLGSEKRISVVVDWFFKETPRPGEFGGGRDGFLEGLRWKDPRRYRLVIQHIISDDRLNILGPASTRILMESVQGFLGEPLLDDKEFEQFHGLAEAEGPSKPPFLSEWRKKLRDSLSKWAPRPGKQD